MKSSERVKRPAHEYLEFEGPIKAFAHQGAGDVVGVENRNTLAAFRAAVELGYPYVELDTCGTRDGEVIVSHGSSSVKEFKATGFPLRSELESMDYEDILKKYPNTPLLSEVFEELPDTRINIDTKTDLSADLLPGVIKDARAIGRVCIASFEYGRTKAVAEMLGGQDKVATATGKLAAVTLLAAARLDSQMLRGILKTSKAACLQLPYQHVTPRMNEIAHELGFEVHVWTPDTRRQMELSLDDGVDGVMTNNTRRLRRVLRRRGQWHEELDQLSVTG